MPWSRAKALLPPDNELFETCFRLQREACEAVGHHIPLVVENVCGAQKWVGRARWHYGSFYLWGDVPALMPMTRPRAKVGGISFSGYGTPNYKAVAFNGTADQRIRAMTDGIKQHGSGREWFAGDGKIARMTSSKSPARKAASAMIAKIPLVLARHIGRTYHPCHD